MSFCDLIAHFLFVLNTITLSGYPTSLLIHLSMEGSLSSLLVLAVTNKAAVNIRVSLVEWG